MRLIDADVLIERIKIPAEWEYHNERRKTFNEVLNYIKKMPTAYDVEAKVAELEKVAFERFGNDGMGGQKVVSLDDAISIVRGKE